MRRFFPFLVVAASLFGDAYLETLYPDWGQWLENSSTVFQEKTEVQDLIIFDNPRFGRVLALDGTIQLTTADEAVYHEMMVHVPLLQHGKAASVLIIGGGDGGSLREVLRHETVKKAILVEIDPSVIEKAKLYLPSLSQGAFENPRAEIVIGDGAEYVKTTKEKFDVIIVDSSDPEGANLVLFSSEFYGDCKKLLTKDGIFVNQNGVPFLQKEEFIDSFANRKSHFKETRFYIAPVPTYVGGFMAFGWASDKNYRTQKKTLENRLAKLKGTMKYYTPEVHLASFALPQFMRDALQTSHD